MILLAKTISPSPYKVLWIVLFILFINQFHHFAFFKAYLVVVPRALHH